MDGVPLASYKLFKPNQFCYVPVTSRNGNKITLAINDTDKTFIVSATYEVFRVADESVLEPFFLFLWFCRTEFDRYARFHSWGSAREAFSYEDMERVMIPVPSLDEQKEIVAAWKGLRKIKDENEALAAPLFQLCQSKIQELKHEYKGRYKRVGDYIEFYREKNKDLSITLEQGIDISKRFITPQRSNADLSSRVIVRKGQFAYCTQLNNENVAIAYREGEDCVVSPVYNVFEITRPSELIPKYLFLWLIRPEFGRRVYWASGGSAYEFLRDQDFIETYIPIPEPKEQQAIVDIYNCALEAKRIAAEADKLSRDICPALMQKVINA